MGRRQLIGFTLVEMLVTLTILAILVGLAVPAMGDYLANKRLRAAAEDLAANFNLARSESLKRNADVYLSVRRTSASQWCYGIRAGSSCDCTVTSTTAANYCNLALQADTNYAGVRLATAPGFSGGSANDVDFNPIRGTSDFGNLHFTSPNGNEVRVDLNALGRAYLCSPSGASHLPGYPTSNCN